MRRETLPTAIRVNGKWKLSEPYTDECRVSCTVYGEMSDGTKVWQDDTGKQWFRQKLFGKYFFVEI